MTAFRKILQTGTSILIPVIAVIEMEKRFYSEVCIQKVQVEWRTV